MRPRIDLKVCWFERGCYEQKEKTHSGLESIIGNQELFRDLPKEAQDALLTAYLSTSSSTTIRTVEHVKEVNPKIDELLKSPLDELLESMEAEKEFLKQTPMGKFEEWLKKHLKNKT